jgi:CRP-like cAMP-binding protein
MRLNMLNELKTLIYNIKPLNQEDWDRFAEIWKPFEAPKNTILTKINELEQYLYFVAEGTQRIYYWDDEDREATLVFTYPPSFGGVLDSLILQKSSNYIYETLTPSRFLRASTDDLHELMNDNFAITLLIKKGIMEAFSGVLHRLVELQCYTSEEKFISLLKRSPHILQIVPHKYLANYLGIDATNFSKLLNRVKI